MKNLKIKHIVSTLIFAFIIAGAFPSCASQSKIDQQRAGLMLQDKSQFSRNKRHYKGSKSHKRELRRKKRLQRKRIKRR